MKKTLLLAGLNLAALAAFGQGTITLGNAFGTSVGIGLTYGPDPSNPWLSLSGQSSLDTPSGTTVYGGSLLTGPGYDAAFYVGPTTATSYAGMTLVSLETTGFRTYTAANQKPEGQLFTGPAIPVPGILGDTPANGGQFANYQLFVWSTTDLNPGDPLFENPVDATSAIFDSELGDIYIGFSPIETTTTTLGGGLITPPQTLVPSFNLSFYTPEPSSVGLVLLGAGSLFVFRRKK
jgi:hypothetical protein